MSLHGDGVGKGRNWDHVQRNCSTPRLEHRVLSQTHDTQRAALIFQLQYCSKMVKIQALLRAYYKLTLKWRATSSLEIASNTVILWKEATVSPNS